MIAAWKLAPALAAGNTVVLKPAEDAPLDIAAPRDADRGGRASRRRRQRVPGLGEIAGAALVAPPGRRQDRRSRAAPRSGARSRSHAAGDFKRVTLELGGKSPQIVLRGRRPRARRSPASPTAFLANQGEICAAGTRLFVAREHRRRRRRRARRRGARRSASATRSTRTTTMGALINEQAARRACSATSTRAGARAPSS